MDKKLVEVVSLRKYSDGYTVSCVIRAGFGEIELSIRTPTFEPDKAIDWAREQIRDMTEEVTTFLEREGSLN